MGTSGYTASDSLTRGQKVVKMLGKYMKKVGGGENLDEERESGRKMWKRYRGGNMESEIEEIEKGMGSR